MKRRRGLRYLFGKLWLALFGWSVDDGAPEVTKAVLIAAPHTSNWDLPFMLALSYVLGINVHWLGKHTLFTPPFGALMRGFGGIAVDRRARHDMVVTGIEALRSREELVLAVPPEGTRARAPHWRTGFYYIARGAEVPILLGYLDYAKKRGGIMRVFHPTADLAADMEVLRGIYAGVQGKFPDQASDIVLRSDQKP